MALTETPLAPVAIGRLLFLDSNCLLDVVRAPFRLRLQDFDALLQVIGAILTGQSIRLVVSSVVPIEYRRHIDDEQLVTQRALSKKFEELKVACHIAVALGAGDIVLPDEHSLGFSPKLRELADKLLSKALQISPSQLTQNLAQKRLLERRAPSHRKSQYEDCLILEECIDFASRERAGGFAERAVFLTSNDRDFCENGVAHPDVQTDLDAVQVQFVSNWSHAAHVLIGS